MIHITASRDRFTIRRLENNADGDCREFGYDIRTNRIVMPTMVGRMTVYGK